MPTGPNLHAVGHQIDRYETQTRNAARARIGTDLARSQNQLRADVTHARAVGDPALLTAARARAAKDLRALRPSMAPALRHAIDEGVRLGANLAGGQVPKGVKPLADPAIKVTLQRMNTPIRRHARLSAAAVERLPLNTDRQLEQVIDRIGAVLSEVDAATGVITSRAVDIGTAAVTAEQGIGRIWVTRSGCCPACAEYSGSFAPPGRGFAPRSDFSAADPQWGGGGDAEPPLHNWCMCRTAPYQPRLADRLARQTEADVAAGRLAASTPARIRAIERMLADDARLTQKTRQRAIAAAARGRFTGQRPANPRSSQSA